MKILNYWRRGIMKVCNFCGRNQDELKLMITSGDNKGDICNECVLVCIQALIENLDMSKEIKIN